KLHHRSAAIPLDRCSILCVIPPSTLHHGGGERVAILAILGENRQNAFPKGHILKQLGKPSQDGHRWPSSGFSWPSWANVGACWVMFGHVGWPTDRIQWAFAWRFGFVCDWTRGNPGYRKIAVSQAVNTTA